MDIFEWSENIPVTANNLNEMQNIINDNIEDESARISNWNLLGTKTGSSSMSLPSSFNELLCVVKVANNDSVQFSIIIPYIVLTTSSQGFNAGYFQQASGNVSAHCRINATKSSANLSYAFLNNSNILSSSTVKYYYR